MIGQYLIGHSPCSVVGWQLQLETQVTRARPMRSYDLPPTHTYTREAQLHCKVRVLG